MSFGMVPSGERKLLATIDQLFSRWLVPFVSSTVVFFFSCPFSVGGMNKVLVLSCLVFHLFYS